MDRIVRLPTVEGLLFTFKDVVYSPEAPRMNEPFTVKGKMDLFRLPFFGPLWIIATAVYPETWWEEIIPIWGSPEVRADTIAIGSDFEVTFSKGFSREGEFPLTLRAYAGPTMPLDTVTLPPFPPVASFETTFIVTGEAPPEEKLFQDFKIKSYGKGSEEPVTPPGVLELEQGDTCRVYLEMSHKGPAVSGEFYASIGDVKPLIGFDEVLVGRGDFTTPSSDDWELYEAHVDIPITAAISPGSYDIYAKIREITGGDVISPILDDVITIKGVPPEGEITNLKIESYDSPVPIGGACNVKVSFDYLGPEVSRRLYAAIGNYGWAGFDEIIYGSKTISIPKTEVSTSYEGDVSIPITTAIDPAGSPYSLYAKIDGVISPILEGVITIAGAVAEGSITSKYINKAPEGSRIELPTTVAADGNTFEVGVTASNTSSISYVAGVEVKVRDPDGILRASPTVDWAGISPGETLRWEYNICRVDKAGSWAIEIRFLERDTSKVLAEVQTTMTATEEAPPLKPPEVETVDAENITHQSATIFGKLIDTSFWSRVKVFFAFGRTSQCENETQRYEMDEYDEGQQFQAELTGLDPGKRYYYKAAVDALGPRSEEVETNYGQTKSFTTEAEVVKGFTMRVVNPPAGAVYWRAGCVAGGTLPYMSLPEPLSYEWKWTKSVPSETLSFNVVASSERVDGWPTVQYDQFYFRLRDGKNYVWDFAAREMREESTTPS